MFGLRRRHRKAEPAPAPLPDSASDGTIRISEEQLFEAVHERLEQFMGADGTWSLVRRNPDDAADDSIFSSMSTILLAKEIASVVLGSPPNRAQTTDEDPSETPTESGIRELLRPVPRSLDEAEQISVELTTIATWADPQRHDPDHVDPRLVTPRSTADEARRA
ncbi:hypothetical protein [Paramicrobacterium agarici]|uniref:Uncharacterized protein n=1 Tax=Paramicrobacterium agarici TaxID=630514 RepID=A0A2A9DXQ3_9MICO|nr:hypothetical protein [Microbacterium agarici]PFG31587.1 hypothetical protein ATJ78_2560 [Microbacterium agarici]